MAPAREREIVPIAAETVIPGAAEVRGALDIPSGAVVGARTDGIIEEALRILSREGAPKGIYLPVTREEFARIYAGEGRNAPATPLDRIHPRADRLALFAATAGVGVSERIRDLFARSDFALAMALDYAASLAAERAGDAVRERFRRDGDAALPAGGTAAAALAYSPGYCGWDVTGQRSLFAALRPEDIGITLNESCLMRPLKSVSGVIVAGSPEIHQFDDDWPFCSACVTRECRERIRRLAISA